MDNSCEIKLNPLGVCENVEAVCKYCQTKFIKYRDTNIYCCKQCRANDFNKLNKSKR